jgi:hypothetical protein
MAPQSERILYTGTSDRNSFSLEPVPLAHILPSTALLPHLPDIQAEYERSRVDALDPGIAYGGLTRVEKSVVPTFKGIIGRGSDTIAVVQEFITERNGLEARVRVKKQTRMLTFEDAQRFAAQYEALTGYQHVFYKKLLKAMERRVVPRSASETPPANRPTERLPIQPGQAHEKENYTSGHGAPTVHLIFNDRALNTQLPPHSYICLFVQDDHPTEALSSRVVTQHINYLVRKVMPAYPVAASPTFLLLFAEKADPSRFSAKLANAAKQHGINSLVIAKHPTVHLSASPRTESPPKVPLSSGNFQKMANAVRRFIISQKGVI